MGIAFNVAVILLRNRSTDPPPAVADVRRYILQDRFSITRFWRDATYDWVSFPRVDFFGWFDVSLPDGTARGDTIEEGKRQARGAGAALGDYGVFLTVVAGKGLDSGASGRGAASINAPDPGHFTAHEIGHAIGFDHTYGIPNTGSDWTDDGVADFNPVYGDPYCIMSGMTFGGARPTVDRTVTGRLSAMPGLPNAWTTGPPPSRACLHFQMPLAAEMAGKVTHIHEGVGNGSALVSIAGGGAPGAEVAVFHPVTELPSGIGRVYVEYRQPEDALEGTRWDQGLATTGGALDRAGVIVHVINPEPGGGGPVVWYVGRILLPTTDLDVTVPTPGGPITVSIDETDVVGPGPPRHVLVRFSRIPTRSVHIIVNSTETRTVTSTEMRVHPDWPFNNPFTWEKRDVTRMSRYRPFVLGLGGAGPFEGESPVEVRWSVGGTALTAAGGKVDVTPSGKPAPVRITFSVNQASRELTLSNRPSDGAYDVPVACTATAPGEPGSISATSTYSAPPSEEGWGPDYYAYLEWWHDITNPIPIEILPPRWWLRQRLERAAERVDAVAEVNPDLAETMTQVMAEVARANMR